MKIKHYYKKLDNVPIDAWLFGGWLFDPSYGMPNPSSGEFSGIVWRVKFNLVIKKNQFKWVYTLWKKR